MRRGLHSRPSPLRRLTLRHGAMLAAGTMLSSVPVLIGPMASASTGAITFTGYGVGEGFGASQYGEAGYASVAHLSYQQILAHYYGGATLASTPDRIVTVALSASTGAAAVIDSNGGMEVEQRSIPAGTPIQIQIQGTTTTVSEGAPGAGCTQSFTPILTVQGALSVYPANLPPLGEMTSEPASQALVWCRPGGTPEAVRGWLTATTTPSGSQVLVNSLGLESYVRGVVGNEMPASWGTLGGAGPQGQAWGFQALEAQAVEARTYVLAVGNGLGYADICDSAYCQVYGGINTSQAPQYAALIDAAQSDTQGEILTQPSGAPAFTQYSASDGGYTAPGGEFPAVPDPYDAGCYGGMCDPYDPWTQSIPLSAIAAAYPNLGTITALNVTGRNGLGTIGGRVTSIQIVGSAGSLTISGAEFASALGLESDWFTMSGPIPIVNDLPASPPPAPPPTAPTSGIVLASSDGGTLAEDGARNLGSTYTLGLTGLSGPRPLAAPIVGMAADPSGNGYWLVGADGGVFNLGGAGYYGSAYSKGYTGLGGSNPLPGKVVGMAAEPDGHGYWLLTSEGTVIGFGDATVYGDLTNSRLPRAPMIGIVATPNGQGYWLIASNGRAYGFGDAASLGSANGTAVAAVGGSGGYAIVMANGGVVGFGGAPSAPALGPTTTGHGAPVVAGVVLPASGQ